MVLMKRKTGENPVRTRHRNKGAKPMYHWETGKMVDAMIFKPGDLPNLSTKRMLKPRVTGCTCESI